jgi:uncharacterized small protein (DUF1192 family)
MIPGGGSNTAAGGYSLAAGLRAKADHLGAFVWGDFTSADIHSSASNQFLVRANGGIWLGKATTDLTPTIGAGVFISTSTGAHLTSGGAWTNASAREAKEGFEAVDQQDVLERVASLPVTTWNYKNEDPAIRHMGPVAQDFAAAFELGGSETAISTVDADGVALAAIQGLYERVQALEAENEELEARLAALEAGAAGASASSSRLSAGWLALMGGIVAVGLVAHRRTRGGRP